MKTQETVELIMQGLGIGDAGGKVIVATPDDPVSEAEQLFLRHDLHHLPIVLSKHDDTLVGIVSTHDVLKFHAEYNGADPALVPLSAIMTATPVRITPSTTIRHAVALLAEAPFQALPVVNAADRIIGIVTTRDVVRYLDALYDRPRFSLRPLAAVI